MSAPDDIASKQSVPFEAAEASAAGSPDIARPVPRYLWAAGRSTMWVPARFVAYLCRSSFTGMSEMQFCERLALDSLRPGFRDG